MKMMCHLSNWIVQFMKKIQYYVDYNNKQNTFEKMTIILFQNIKDQTMSTTGYLTLVGIMSSIIKYLIANVLFSSQSPTFCQNNMSQFNDRAVFFYINSQHDSDNEHDLFCTMPFSWISCRTVTLSVLRVQIRDFQVMRGSVF